jgi:hypothetical protein
VMGEMATLRPLMAGEDTGDQMGEVSLVNSGSINAYHLFLGKQPQDFK